jgi:hypothetical protein
MARICSIRKATSRPRFSPASVITENVRYALPTWVIFSLASGFGAVGSPAARRPGGEFRNLEGLAVFHDGLLVLECWARSHGHVTTATAKIATLKTVPKNF